MAIVRAAERSDVGDIREFRGYVQRWELPLIFSDTSAARTRLGEKYVDIRGGTRLGNVTATEIVWSASSLQNLVLFQLPDGSSSTMRIKDFVIITHYVTQTAAVLRTAEDDVSAHWNHLPLIITPRDPHRTSRTISPYQVSARPLGEDKCNRSNAPARLCGLKAALAPRYPRATMPPSRKRQLPAQLHLLRHPYPLQRGRRIPPRGSRRHAVGRGMFLGLLTMRGRHGPSDPRIRKMS